MLALLAVLLLLVPLGSTDARWRDAERWDPGRVSSGQLQLLLGDGVSQVEAYPFTSLATASLAPGVAAQAPLTVRNGGSVALGYRLGSTAAGSALASALTLRLVPVATAGGCPTGTGVAAPAGTALYSGPLPGATTAGTRRLLPGATEVLCVRVGLPTSAPAGLQGRSAVVALTFTGQVEQ